MPRPVRKWLWNGLITGEFDVAVMWHWGLAFLF